MALHAHPYSFTFDQESKKKKNTHSNEEYELYDSIYNAPILELEFFYFKILPFYYKLNTTFSKKIISYESKIKLFQFLRGPPVLGLFF